MLHLDLDGLELQLKINRFREDLPGGSEYDNWCFTDFTVMHNGNNVYHNYKNLPWLTCNEVKKLRDTIAGIIDGSITKIRGSALLNRTLNLNLTLMTESFLMQIWFCFIGKPKGAVV